MRLVDGSGSSSARCEVSDAGMVDGGAAERGGTTNSGNVDRRESGGTMSDCGPAAERAVGLGGGPERETAGGGGVRGTATGTGRMDGRLDGGGGTDGGTDAGTGACSPGGGGVDTGGRKSCRVVARLRCGGTKGGCEAPGGTGGFEACLLRSVGGASSGAGGGELWKNGPSSAMVASSRRISPRRSMSVRRTRPEMMAF